MATLLLLTESYPYGGVTEPSFVAPEIGALAREFDRVIIAPVLEAGELMPLPEGVEVSRAMLRRPGVVSKALYLLRPSLWRHLWADRRFIHSLRRLRAAIAYSVYTLHYRRIIRRLIPDVDSTLVYCFWFEYQASALAGIRGAKFLARAHGHDVYDSQNPFLSHSWRHDTLRAIRALFPVAQSGADYIAADYPEHADKVSVRSLGSRKPLALNPPTNDNTLTLLSISRLSPEKGVVRQLHSVIALAKALPGTDIRWISVGDGPQRDEIERIVSSGLPANLRVEMLGAMPNADVHQLLASRHIDFVVLLSFSEGLPIAVCESMSYGVPVIASAVGGIPEIVNDEVGVLLSPNPTPQEFVRRVSAALPRRAERSVAARRRWTEAFDADRLRADFAHEIRRMLP